MMPERFILIGTSRSGLGDEEFVDMVRSAVEESDRRPSLDGSWGRFAASLRFAGLSDGYEALGEAVAQAREDLGGDPTLLHYLSLPPAAAAGTVEALGRLGLGEGARVIMEKPFGVDLDSARELDARVHSVFEESRVFRIDHYLGREAVQNLLAVRFANGMFEPVWNRDHIDHIQIDIPETLSIGMRADFYEQTGAFRDMVVTHLFQVLSFVAMEPPTSLSAKSLMTERQKVFDSMLTLAPEDVVRGQYVGYREEEGVGLDSETETLSRCGSSSTTGVGRGCRSTCARASAWPRVATCSPSPSRATATHVPARLRSGASESFGHDHLSFELGDPGRSRLASWPRCPARRYDWARLI